jgi:hypothetical protein
LVEEAAETYSHKAAEGEEEVEEKRWDNNEGNIRLVEERKVWPRKVGTEGCWK